MMNREWRKKATGQESNEGNVESREPFVLKSEIRNQQSAGGQSAQIDKIVDSVIHQEGGGRSIDDAEIEQRYPELMPELRESLRTARAIHAAARCARQELPSSGSDDGRTAPFEDDLKFLGEALDGYEILERLEEGGQGVVYKAVQKATRRTVAIKVLLDGPLASDRQRHRFEREVNLVSRLRHPNIVTLYESGVVRGRQYFAMEYVEGLPISDYVLLHRVPVEEAVRLFAKVCRAISSAHQRGIIHRDLKPTNIFVDLDGEPHVLDFGLAKCLEDAGGADQGPSISLTGQVAGTLAYLSPEQAGGAGGDVDVRSDIYALGLILYRLLTGAFPYSIDGEPSTVRDNIVSHVPQRLHVAMRDPDAGIRPTTGPISDDLERIIFKALAKEKSRRYQSADALAADLDRYLTGEAVEAKADSSLYLLRKTIRKYRIHATFTAIILVLLIVASVLVTSLWWRARAESQRAQAERDIARQVVVLATATLDEVVNEFETSIRTLAGGAAVRDRLLERMAGKLQQLRLLVESDVALEDVAARLDEKQGDIAHAQGHRAEAADYYQAFLAISLRRAGKTGGDAGGDDPRLDVARAHRKLAAVSDDADVHFERAVELGEALLRRQPDAAGAKQELCTARLALAQHLYDAGRYEDAAHQAEAAAAAAAVGKVIESASDDPHWNDLLATAWGLRGGAQLEVGEGESGLASLEASLHLREGMSARRPADVRLRYKLLLSYVRLGALHRDAGRLDQATVLLEKAVDVGEYLTSVDPTVTTWKRDVYGAHHQLARLFLEGDQLDLAEPHCAAAVDLAESLLKTEPDNPEWRRIAAFSYIRRGRLLLASDQPQLAHEDFEKAVVIRCELCRRVPEDLALQCELASAHDWLGKCSSRLGRAAQAREHYAAAYAIRESLLQAQPEVTKRALDVILSQTKLATWHLRQHTAEDDEAASEWLDKAEASLAELDAAGRLAAWRGRYDAWKREIDKSRRLIARRRAEREGRTDVPPD
jgi:serine/threonine protein kinase